MYETVAVAIKINESGETLTSSVVDDVFYILQKCARRASETGENPATKPTFQTPILQCCVRYFLLGCHQCLTSTSVFQQGQFKRFAPRFITSATF